MAEPIVIGDRIDFDGYPAARISSALPASVRARFEDALENAVEDEPEIVKAKDKTEVLDTVLAEAKKCVDAGMIELADLEQIIRELKDQCE